MKSIKTIVKENLELLKKKEKNDKLGLISDLAIENDVKYNSLLNEFIKQGLKIY